MIFMLRAKTKKPSPQTHSKIVFKNMSPQITIKKDYILVEPKAGIEFREIQQGLARLYFVEGMPEQNRVWIFREGPKNLSPDDLDRLKRMVTEYYPADASIRKTAIVVTSEQQANLSESFIKIAEDLPQEFKVFTNLADAEKWVKE
jgi:hypothetical protein